MADPGLHAALDAGEKLTSYVSIQATTGQGAVRYHVAPVYGGREHRHRSLGPRILGFFSGNWVPRWARGDLLERMIGGVAADGPPGSCGASLLAAAKGADGLVVTDRRLLVVKRGATSHVDDAQSGRRKLTRAYAATWATPIAEVVAARRSGRPNGLGRVELYFRDGSMGAIVAGVLTAGAAGRLLAALQVPRSPDAPIR